MIRPRTLCSVLLLLLAATCVSQAPAATLAELEARHDSPDLVRDLAALIEGNGVKTGPEFHRAAQLLPAGGTNLHVAQMRYELLLAAVAQGQSEAEPKLALAWDDVVVALGRPVRTEEGLATHDGTQAAPAPEFIQAVFRDPAGARAAARQAKDNPEIAILSEYRRAPAVPTKNVPSGFGPVKDLSKRPVALNPIEAPRRARLAISRGPLRSAKDFAGAARAIAELELMGRELAHEVALAALITNGPEQSYAVAATYDRFLRVNGRPQRFGTQRDCSAVTRIDDAGIVDAVRAALRCPPPSRTPPDESKLTISELQPIVFRLKPYGVTEEVIDLEQRIIAKMRADRTLKPPFLATNLIALATSLNGSGRATEAEPLAREAEAIRRAEYGEAHFTTAAATGAIGLSLFEQHRHAEAEPLLVRSYEMQAAVSDLPKGFQRNLRTMANCLVALGEATARPDWVAKWRACVADFDARYPADPADSTDLL